MCPWSATKESGVTSVPYFLSGDNIYCLVLFKRLGNTSHDYIFWCQTSLASKLGFTPYCVALFKVLNLSKDQISQL